MLYQVYLLFHDSVNLTGWPPLDPTNKQLKFSETVCCTRKLSSHKLLLKMSETEKLEENSEFRLKNIFFEIVQSPVNLGLVFLIFFLVYKIVKSRKNDDHIPPPEPELPKLKKRDFTVEELKKYDGNQEDGRVLVAVNGNVYDVTKGKRFYGPGR